MLTITFGFTGTTSRTISLLETQSASSQTLAIQTALDTVAGHTGGFVKLSGGTFTVTGTGKASDGALRVGSETTVSGAGMGSTILKLAAGSSSITGILRTDSGGTNADGTVKTTSNVTIENLSIDGNKSATMGDVDGFYCGPKPNSSSFDSNIKLDRVEIHDVSRYGFDPHEQTHGLTFANTISHHNGVDGYTIDFASDVSLVNNSAYANGRHGFNVVTSSSDVRFLDNDSWGNGQSGLVIQTGDNEVRAFTQNISVIGGHIHDNGRDGIEVRQALSVSVSDAWIDNNKGYGISIAGVDGATLNRNTLINNGDGLKIAGLLQDFGDTDSANDRYIATHNVAIDGVSVTDPAIPQGVTPWTYKISAGAETINGSSGRDAIAAGDGADTVFGNGGNDTLFGEGGWDRISGGTGNDVLFGNEGNDWLSGEAGNDFLTGGTGSDTFAFQGHWGSDTVTDFRDRADKFKISGVSGLTKFAQLSVSQSGSDVKIAYGGDTILLKGVAVSTIDANDFIFA